MAYHASWYIMIIYISNINPNEQTLYMLVHRRMYLTNHALFTNKGYNLQCVSANMLAILFLIIF